jgi:hypothetical protein
MPMMTRAKLERQTLFWTQNATTTTISKIYRNDALESQYSLCCMSFDTM